MASSLSRISSEPNLVVESSPLLGPTRSDSRSLLTPSISAPPSPCAYTISRCTFSNVDMNEEIMKITLASLPKELMLQNFDKLVADILDVNSKACLEILLENSEWPINQPLKKGNTLLHCACHKGSVEMIDYLLQRRADFTIPNSAGKSAIDKLLERKLTGQESTIFFLHQFTRSVCLAQKKPPSEALLSTFLASCSLIGCQRAKSVLQALCTPSKILRKEFIEGFKKLKVIVLSLSNSDSYERSIGKISIEKLLKILQSKNSELTSLNSSPNQPILLLFSNSKKEMELEENQTSRESKLEKSQNLSEIYLASIANSKKIRNYCSSLDRSSSLISLIQQLVSDSEKWENFYKHFKSADFVSIFPILRLLSLNQLKQLIYKALDEQSDKLLGKIFGEINSRLDRCVKENEVEKSRFLELCNSLFEELLTNEDSSEKLRVTASQYSLIMVQFSAFTKLLSPRVSCLLIPFTLQKVFGPNTNWQLPTTRQEFFSTYFKYCFHKDVSDKEFNLFQTILFFSYCPKDLLRREIQSYDLTRLTFLTLNHPDLKETFHKVCHSLEKKVENIHKSEKFLLDIANEQPAYTLNFLIQILSKNPLTPNKTQTNFAPINSSNLSVHSNEEDVESFVAQLEMIIRLSTKAAHYRRKDATFIPELDQIRSFYRQVRSNISPFILHHLDGIVSKSAYNDMKQALDKWDKILNKEISFTDLETFNESPLKLPIYQKLFLSIQQALTNSDEFQRFLLTKLPCSRIGSLFGLLNYHGLLSEELVQSLIHFYQSMSEKEMREHAFPITMFAVSAYKSPNKKIHEDSVVFLEQLPEWLHGEIIKQINQSSSVA